jgi:predicted RNA binding protein YcfA (HicA-like mRNA interferase family)
MKLPVVSGPEAAKALCRLGYEVDVQEGSHVILRHSQPFAKGTLRTLIRDAGLTVHEFLDLL